MQKQEKSRKPLIIGVIAAVVILAVLLVLLLTQCTGGGEGATTDSNATVESTVEVPTYDLYWNADREEYAGKSEAGMSSRMPEDDGYFHVRFILDGQEVILKVADRKLVNAIDVKDLMGLEFDENGIVVGVVDIDDMPLEKLGWQFYVQSAAKTLIKLNSSEGMNGMEVLLETDENTGIYDMTGKSGPVGVTAEPINMDRVYAVANLAGEVTHVFIYQRPNYMLTHEGECEHCKKTVTWYEWVKTDAMPLTTGHYQLQNDIQLTAQPAQAEDAKVCIDLNGKRVDGKSGARCYAMFNAGTELAIMDTSEGQTGVMAAHGKGDQGMVVWVRYGAFYLYGGTLDASDATTKLNGTAVECGKGKFFYMYGGTIIGGTAEPQKNDKGNWTNGLGGTMSIGGKFVMNGGEIRDGYAKAVVTWKDGNPTYNRGIGGNIYASTSAVIELNGGVIKNGRAGNIGGNIYLDGAAELTINGGKISGGTISGKGKNGGSIFAGAKTKIVLSSGSVYGGTCRNCGGNIYTNGVLTMTGGYIGGGTIRDFATGKVTENAASANIFIVNGRFNMYGGKIDGGVQAIDTNATDNKDTTVYLTTYATIDGGDLTNRNLTLSSGGSGITVRVGNLRDSAKIGVYATTGYFTLPTLEENKDNFFSDIEGAEVLYHDERLALGRLQCICGQEEHIGECDGTLHVFAPWTSTNSLPNTAGKYYLLKDVKMTGTTSVVTNEDGKNVEIVLDLNGKTVKKAGGSSRVYSLFENKVAKNPDGTYAGNIEGEGIYLTLTDSVGTATVDLNTVEDGDQGLLVWGRYNDSKISIYGGTYNGEGLNSNRHDGVVISTSGELNIYGGTFNGGNSNKNGGIISVSGSKGVFNLYDGIIRNGTSKHSGGNVNIGSGATMNMYGGTITGGSINADGTMVGDLGYGGNIVVTGTLNMYDGTISDGLVKIGLAGQNADGTKISAGGGLSGNLQVNGTANLMGGIISGGNASTGGNIGTNNANSSIILDGVQVLDGTAGSGGNIAINVRAGKLLEIKGDTVVSGGKATGNGGNLYANAWVANSKDVVINISGGTIKDGTAGIGGNVYLINTTSGEKAGKNVLTMSGGTISGGKLTDTTKNGGSIYINSNSEFVLNDGTVTGGGSAKQGGNFYLPNSNTKLIVNGGEILNGDANDCGGNVQLQGRAVLEVNGGLIKGGTKNGVQNSNSNIYSVNGNVTVTGGEIVGGFSNTSTYDGGCIIKLDKDAYITTNEAGYGLSRGRWTTFTADLINISLPLIQVGELSDKASIALGTSGYNTVAVDEKYVDNFVSALNDAEVCYDGQIFLGKSACICGGTSEFGPCAEGGHKKVLWTAWDGQPGTMLENGNYYLTKDATVSNQNTFGNEASQTSSGTTKKYARPTNVAINLNGHSITAGFRIFQMWNESTLSIADHKGGGALLTKGNTGDNFGIIQMLGSKGTVHFYSGEIGFAEGYKTHKVVALIESAGTFNMYGGEISGGTNPTSTLIRVAGTFNMYAGTVKDGYNATIDTTTNVRGGNFYINGGTLNVYGGTITGGQAKYGGNIAATGKVNVYGGTISDGYGYTGEAKNYPQGGNIWLSGASAALNVNGKATISGGQLTGSNWMPGGSIYANSKATITIDGGATVTGGDGQDGNNIYLASDGTTLTLKDCTIENTVDGTGNIMVERGNVTIDGATIINKANGYNLRANETTKIANFTMNSGLVTGGKPNVTLGGDDTFVMNGGTIENGTSASHGGNISLSNSKFTLNAGTITGGVATKEGGNICMSGASELVINGGEIKDGTANGGNGGNIIVWDTSTVTMNDGTISGGTCTGNGGNVALSSKTTMTVNGGKVLGGESGDSAGNIVVYGKLTVNGGEIANGKSGYPSNGMNISVINTNNDVTAQYHELVITGGTISGGLHFNNHAGDVIVSISGNPVIDKELATANKPTYSMKLDKNDLNIGQLTDGAKIVVSGKEGVFSYKAPEGSAQYFHSEVEGLNVFQTPADELVLVYGKTGCICGSTDGNHIGECDGTQHNWMPVTAFPETSGYYYLVSDVTDSGSQRKLSTDQNIVLDLNGKTLNSDRFRMLHCDAAINFTITDNSANRNGRIVITGDQDQGSLFWSNSTSSLSLYGGIIDASAAKIGDNDGLVGLIHDGSATLKLYRGTIMGGTAVGTNWGGAAISLGGSKTHVFGEDLVVTSVAGSPIYIGDNAKIDVSGLTKAPATAWAVDASGIFTVGWNAETMDIEDYFENASAFGAEIWVDEATGELFMGRKNCVCGQTPHIGDCDGTEQVWRPWRSVKAMPNGGNWYLTRDVVQAGQTVFNKDTAIDLNGKNFTFNVPVGTDGYRMLRSDAGANVVITDTSGTPGTMKLVMPDYSGESDAVKTAMEKGNQGMLIWIREAGGQFDIYNGILDGSQIAATQKDGASVYIGSNGVLNVHGGTIKLGSIGWSSNIYVGASATMNITGGTVVGGKANNGGAIGVYGTLNISGGTITGGNSTANGNNINVNSGGKVVMTGGKIVSTVDGPETAVRSNVNVASGATFTMSGGSIENTASNVRNVALNGTFNMSGGTIKGGKIVRSDNGANVAVWADAVFTMSGGSVVEGRTANQGGNVAVYGTLKVSGNAVIKDGHSDKNAGHNVAMIHTGGQDTLEMNGGSIAGGVYMNNYSGNATVKLSGAPVIDKSLTSSTATQPTDSLRISYAKGTSDNTLLDVTGLTGGTIYVKGAAAGQFATNATEAMVDYFVSETYEGETLLPVCYDNGGLYFGQVYCLCGYTKSGSTLTAHEYWCDQVNHLWLPWNGSHFMTDGYYYATGAYNPAQTSIGNSDTDAELVTAHVVFDLNGKTLTSGGRSFRVENGSFSVTDSVGGGKVVAGGTDTQAGSILITNGTTINLYKGDWTLTSGKSAGTNGGIVEIGTGTVLNMYSGTISGGTATEGGNVSVTGGTFNFYGGTITGGTAKMGGNVRVTSGSFNMIPSPLDTKGVATRTISGGNATREDGSYAKGGNIFVTGTNSSVTISGAKSLVENGTTYTLKNGASGWAPGGNIEVEGSAKLTVSSGATVKGGTGSQGNNIYMTGNASKITLDGAVMDNTTAKAENIYIEGGILDVKGTTQIKTVNGARNINTNANGKPVINISGGTITGANFGGVGANINLSSTAEVNMSNGTITGGYANASGNNGGSIYIGGTFNLSGGTITGGKAANGGGNIANYGTLNISGGKIYGGSAVDAIRYNIYSQGVINISGGEVWGGVTMHNLGKANLNVSGAAVINGKLNATAIPSITFWGYESNPVKPLNITGKLTGTACIGIATYDWAFANAGTYTADSINAFFADDASRGIYLLDSTDSQAGMLYVGQYNCICGGTATEGACADGGHQKVRWTAWDGAYNSITADGNYYLIGDNTVGSQNQIGTSYAKANVSINLNGHTLTGTYRIFQVRAGGNLNIADHKGGGALLTKGYASDNYGILQMYACPDSVVNFYSGKIGMAANYVAHKSVALIQVEGTFNMYSGEIFGGETTTGTLVNIGNAGIFNMYSGTVRDGNRNGNGGNFAVSGKLNIYGGTVEDGFAVQGGNIYVADAGTVTLSNGTIQNGKASDCGGNIHNTGTLNVSGGTITGGKKAASATETGSYENNSNIYLVNGDLTMTGGTIDGLNACNTSANGCVINISGKAKITNADGFGLSLISWATAGTAAPAAPVIDLGALDASASICVRGQLDRVFATGTGAIHDNKGYFTSNDGYQVICTEEGMMMVAADAHAHCECGGLLADDETHTCWDVVYEALESDMTVFEGTASEKLVANYYVPASSGSVFNMDGTITVRHNSEVRICLNGQTLSNTGRTISIFCDGTDGEYCTHDGTSTFIGDASVIIADCGENGTVRTTTKSTDFGRAIWVRKGKLTVYKANIVGDQMTSGTHTGAVMNIGNNCTATLYDVTVKGGFGNELSGAQSAIHVAAGATLKLKGDFAVDSGDATGIHLAETGLIDVTNAGKISGPISVNAAGIFTAGNNGTENAERFKPAFDANIFVSTETKAGELFMGLRHCVCGVNSDNVADHKADCGNKQIEWKPVRVLNAAPTSTGNYYLVDDSTTGQKNLTAGMTVYLDLNGHSLTNSTGGRVYRFSEANAKLVITDGKDGGSVKGSNNTQGSTLWAPSANSILEIWGGTIYASDNANNGGNAEGGSAILLKGSGSKLIINGGTVVGGTVDGTTKNEVWGGGAISVLNATFTMNGGTITGGTANRGGSVYIYNTTFVMNDGIIEKGKTTNDNGGCLYVNAGSFTMNGGTIRNGVAANCGGNVDIGGGSFTMNGGTITGGTASGSKTANHANLFVVNASFTMTSGKIDGYAAAISYNGGECSVTISGSAKITNADNTHGLYLDNGGENYVKGYITLDGLSDDAYITVVPKANYASGDVLVKNVLTTETDNLNITKAYLYDSENKEIYLK